MADDSTQQAVYQFIGEKYRSGETFSEEEIQAVSNWKDKTLDTYLSKQFRGLLTKTGRGNNAKYSVSDVFLRYPTFQHFRPLVTQVKRVAEDYTLLRYGSVLVYDFFMPLSNEDALRRALDSLFFKDTVLQRLRRLNNTCSDQLDEHFGRLEGETDDSYFDRLLTWIDNTFGGYSIMHVAGRFKVPPLRTAAEAGDWYKDGGRYLVDETTAVVRFIFPCCEPVKVNSFATPPTDLLAESEALYRATQVEWFFWRLFVESIIRVIDAQDEVWMVESGMKNRLHVWRMEN